MKCNDVECTSGEHGEEWRCLGHSKHRDDQGRKVPCKARRIKGGRTCRMHGVNEAAKQSARQRLDGLVEPAVAALSAALRMVERHPSVALNPSVQRAALGVLDRCGYKPINQVELLGLEDAKIQVVQQHGSEIAEIIKDVLRAAGVDTADPAVRAMLRARLEAQTDEAVERWRRDHPPPEPETERPKPRGGVTEPPENEGDEEDEVVL